MIPPPSPPPNDRAIAAALGLLSLTLYALTAAPSLAFIDSGELATVAWTLGIAHPTGYPLFTLVGYLVAHAPLPLAPILKLNLLSAAFSAVAVGAFFLLAMRLLAAPSGLSGRAGTARQPGDRSAVKGAASPDRWPAVGGAVVGALSLAFSATWWSGATSVEVYPMHGLFLVLLIGCFLAAFPRDRREGGAGARYLFAFVLGLSFTNHMSTIYLAPAFLTLYAMRRGVRKESLMTLLAMGPAFLLGFSLNLYLPVRASTAPLMNWGNCVDPEAILRHLGGKQYGVWLFSSTATAAKQLSHFFGTIGPRFSFVPLALALWGMKDLFRKDRHLFILLLLLFLGCLAFAVNYDIEDIDSYFVLADIALALAAAAGMAAVLEASRGRARTIVLTAAGLFLGWHAARTWPDADQGGLRQVDQYARTLLTGADSGSVIISYQWDYFISASYYLQEVEGVRPDVMVVDKELLRRSWYIGSLRRRYPLLLDGLGPETDAYLAELYKFENGIPYDPRAIEARYAALIAGIIRRHYDARAVYVTADIETRYTPGYLRIPHGLALRMRREGDPHLWSEVPVIVDPPGKNDRYLDAITMLAARAEYTSAGYLEYVGDRDAARRAAERSVAIRPDFAEARAIRERLSR
jgi:hypothetical protein